EIEHHYGVRGSYFLRTGPTDPSIMAEALPMKAGSGPCPGGGGNDYSSNDCFPQITSNIAYMANDLGALFGSHTTDERTEPLDTSSGNRPVGDSLDRLRSYLPLNKGQPVRPTIFVTPGALAILDETIQGLSDAGITTTGAIAYGPH